MYKEKSPIDDDKCTFVVHCTQTIVTEKNLVTVMPHFVLDCLLNMSIALKDCFLGFLPSNLSE